MRMGLDFAWKSPWRAATAMLLVLGVLASGHALWMRHKLLDRRAAVLVQMDARQQASQKMQPVHQTPLRPEAMEEASRLVAGLQRPWEPMLNALQESLRDDVVVNRVQPENDAFRLRISGQADSSQAFVEFVQRLRDDASWRTVDPLSEATQTQSAENAESGSSAPGGKPVAFQLAAEWRRP